MDSFLNLLILFIFINLPLKAPQGGVGMYSGFYEELL